MNRKSRKAKAYEGRSRYLMAGCSDEFTIIVSVEILLRGAIAGLLFIHF
jgi:hypothetical protein